MNENGDISMEDELRAEYDFAAMGEGVRGKYIERYRASHNIVRLDPDVAKVFSSDEAVNNALRLLIQIAQNNVNYSST
jgi:hypothetical protein